MLATAGSGFLGGVNAANFFVQLAPHEERTFGWGRLLQWPPWRAFQGNFTQREIQQQIRRRLGSIPDVRVAIRNPQTFVGGGGNWDIDFALLGPDLDILNGYAERLRTNAPSLGLLDADTTLKLDKPELRVQIDRDRAANLGVRISDIADALRVMVGGDERVTRFRDESMNEDYDVQVRLKEGDRNEAEPIARLFVPREAGGLVRLDNVVKLVPTQTASRIDRLDRQRQVSLRASVAPGYAQADRIAALRAEVAKIGLPTGYSTRVSGRARELETTFREFIFAFALSVVLMYIILASQFESLVHPFTILLSLPLSVPFAFVSLLAANQTINLYSALGLLVLFGVVKKNAILQIDHMNKLRAGGDGTAGSHPAGQPRTAAADSHDHPDPHCGHAAPGPGHRPRRRGAPRRGRRRHRWPGFVPAADPGGHARSLLPAGRLRTHSKVLGKGAMVKGSTRASAISANEQMMPAFRNSHGRRIKSPKSCLWPVNSPTSSLSTPSALPKASIQLPISSRAIVHLENNRPFCRLGAVSPDCPSVVRATDATGWSGGMRCVRPAEFIR